MTLRILPFLCFLLASAAWSQDTARAGAALTVYLDCPDGGCDSDYFRTEITFVNWVRDRQVADVHLLITGQSTGAGGREFTLGFIGLRRFARLSDTLHYVQPPASTEAERRQGLAGIIRAGLVRYLARTPAAGRLTLTVSGAGAAPQATAANDPWNFWVFRLSLNSWLSGEKTYRATELFGNLNADRVSQGWKTRLSARESYDESVIDVDDSTRFVRIERSYGASLLQVKSLGRRWSAGVRASMSSSTYENYLRVLQVFPAIEFNVFPYAQSTRRQLVFEYDLGYGHYDYRDTTIFDRIEDRLPIQRLIIAGEAKEQWGSVEGGIGATSYLNDRTKYRLSSEAGIRWRLFRGMNLNLNGGYEVIRDQFALAKKDFSPEEILTRQYQRETTYRYRGSIGISYTFGSIYNNVVNPRLQMGGFFF